MRCLKSFSRAQYRNGLWYYCEPTGNYLTSTTPSGCYGPEWNRIVDQSSSGATRHSGPESIKECLDYCVQTPGCVAVDVQVNVFPPGCWPHFNESYLVPSNTYFLEGTTQYRLVTRCSSVIQSICTSSREPLSIASSLDVPESSLVRMRLDHLYLIVQKCSPSYLPLLC